MKTPTVHHVQQMHRYISTLIQQRRWMLVRILRRFRPMAGNKQDGKLFKTRQAMYKVVQI